MKKILLLLAPILLVACALFQQAATTCPPPSVVTVTKDSLIYLPPKVKDSIILHDSTVIVTRHRDSVSIRDSLISRIINVSGVVPLLRTVPLAGNGDSTLLSIDLLTNSGWISPVSGDSWATCQNASDYCIANSIPLLHTTGGVFNLSQTWVLYKLQNGDYYPFTLLVDGSANAQDGTVDVLTMLNPTFRDGPTVAFQLCKSGGMQNVGSQGQYTLPYFLNQTQILTYTWEQWSDGLTADGRTNPHAFIAVDPFSDPSFYDSVLYKKYARLGKFYIPGMKRSGSTGLIFKNLGCSGYVVGYVITPSFQFNGELMKFENCRSDYSRAAYAQTQAQSKENKVLDFMDWGASHVAFDGVHFGAWRGDGVAMPNIDGVNMAGTNYEAIESYTYTFPTYITNFYSEGTGKLGILKGPEGAIWTNLQFDIPYGNSIPTQDPFYDGAGSTFIGGHIRYYGSGQRFILNSPGTLFIGFAFSEPPICMGITQFLNCRAYYSNYTPYFSRNDYDSIITIHDQPLVRVNGAYNGYILSSLPGSYVVGDQLYTPGYNPQGDVPPFLKVLPNPYLTVGNVTLINKDTVWMTAMGTGMIDSTVLAPILIARYKAGFNFN